MRYFTAIFDKRNSKHSRSVALFVLLCSSSNIPLSICSSSSDRETVTSVVNNSSTPSASSSVHKSGINETSIRDSRQLISLIKNILSNPNKSQLPTPLQPQYQQEQEGLKNPYQVQYPGGFHHPPSASASFGDQKIHSANINQIQNSYQYPMLNYPTQQHSSVPFYNENLHQQQQQQPTEIRQQYIPQQVSQGPQSQNLGLFSSSQGSSSNSNGNPLLSLLTSALSGSGGVAASSSSNPNNGIKGVANMLSKLGLLEDLDLSNIFNFASVDGVIGKVNQFDKLQCIPRMICETVSKRNDEAKKAAATSTTTTTTTERTTTTRSSSKKSKKKQRHESGRFIKIDGVDSAIDQLVKFLELMQLRDWSLYPYVKGIYEGHQSRRPHECAERFRSCPFSEDQLVYYFNNYNGGFFQSFRSGKYFHLGQGANETKVGGVVVSS